jgi:type IV secretion system protein VirB9
VPIPAILITNEKGEEGPVNYAVRGDTIVIPGVPSRIVLRAGRQRAQLDYKGQGPKPRSGAQAAAAVAAVPVTQARSE